MRRKKIKKGEKKLSLILSKKELMNRALSAITINIGKAGINDSVIDEIKRHLKSQELVKLRFAKNISSEKEFYITQIVEKTNSKLIDLRGNVAVIFKKNR
jgi:RNA-binding protein